MGSSVQVRRLSQQMAILKETQEVGRGGKWHHTSETFWSQTVNLGYTLWNWGPVGWCFCWCFFFWRTIWCHVHPTSDSNFENGASVIQFQRLSSFNPAVHGGFEFMSASSTATLPGEWVQGWEFCGWSWFCRIAGFLVLSCLIYWEG